MPQIAVIDDIENEGTSVARYLQLIIGEHGWRCIFSKPLNDHREYNTWTQENDTWALVLDWKLSGVGRSPGKSGVGYTAKEVVESLRCARPDFPIYVITSHRNLASEEDWLGEAEVFEDRVEFIKNINVIAPRILRATVRFRHTYKEALARISTLSIKSAQGLITKEEVEELHATRASIRLDSTSIPEQLADVLVEAEAIQREVDATIKEIRASMEKKK